MKTLRFLPVLTALLFAHNSYSLTPLRAATFATAYVMGITGTFVHEMGHKMAAKTLLNIPSTISVSLNPLKMFIPGIAGYTKFARPLPKKGWKSAAVHAAGPIAGMAYAALIHKLADFFPTHQKGRLASRIIKHFAWWEGISNALNLLPVKLENDMALDGYNLMQALS